MDYHDLLDHANVRGRLKRNEKFCLVIKLSRLFVELIFAPDLQSIRARSIFTSIFEASSQPGANLKKKNIQLVNTYVFIQKI